ncbi:50S ribosomal protein L23 [Candidatus Kaiserbacteria bacterium RIFCSPHIGHO2_01_FULL_55_17]|uniref:Large ribosomal subunit protein uL23 n=1 Tax=Candidatus Kaiserbacteria bacterium RIFCSPHIGHO2_01_FULL_55_17 TaxID=1798484 RepID=A0A1F6D7W0_9BACT|nr:MAG: 50S ribosomal protein L23 [Candidatus Kaiserbacteria bacterium RIFCSPHIGHO2_01_FULL_55_17]
MALFQRKAEEKKADAAPVAAPTGAESVSDVLRNPRITEKATGHAEGGIYTFDVSPVATKRSVVQAIRSLYKVVPKKVRIVPILSKARRNVRTGQRGSTRGGKKAYIYLKKGDTITIS